MRVSPAFGLVALAAFCFAAPARAQSASASATPAPTAAPSASATPATAASPALAAPESAVPPLYVDGQILTIGRGFVAFTSGDALRLRAGTLVPKGIKTGTYVRVTLDQLAREITAIELEPRLALAGEIEIANLGRQYVVATPGSAKTAPRGDAGSASVASALVSITILVTVPGNTPTTDDIYLATDRSNYSPSEIRMQRLDARRFSVSLSLATGTRLRYEFTRGNVATIERDRSGGIVQPRELPVAADAKSEDTVARWADLN